LSGICWTGWTTLAQACPFCDAQGYTLTQQRESAIAAALGEVVSAREGQLELKFHQIVVGKELLSTDRTLWIATKVRAAEGQLIWATAQEATAQVAIGTAQPWDWTLTRIDEIAAGYVLRTPGTRMDPVERLRFFRKYCEHPNEVIAADAYLEFAQAPFDVVREVAGAFVWSDLERWLTDPQVPARRRGLYGLLAGLQAEAAPDAAKTGLLERLVFTPAPDFRAGFDGLVGGYLLATGSEGLKKLRQQFFENPRASVADLRHSANALRFFWESSRRIPQAELRSAMRLLVTRKDLAREVIFDLARWNDWEAEPLLMSIYQGPPAADIATKRAIVGYLLNSPRPEARADLERLRASDPQLVQEVEAFLPFLGGVRE